MTDKKTTTKLDASTIAKKVQSGESAVLNPTGKGGFQDRPQDRSNGRWKKENSISYNYNLFMAMSEDEFDEFKGTTMAQSIAYNRIKAAKKSLFDVKEITDRTEGKAPQSIDMTSKGESVNPYAALSVEELRKLAGK